MYKYSLLLGTVSIVLLHYTIRQSESLDSLAIKHASIHKHKALLKSLTAMLYTVTFARINLHTASGLRMLTTIEEVGWDMGLLVQLGTSLVLNGIILLQVALYWSATDKFVAQQAADAEKKTS
jgi:predicted anti-sigma-YlaC factor YlaD